MTSRGKLEKRGSAVTALDGVGRKRPGLLRHPYRVSLGSSGALLIAAAVLHRPDVTAPAFFIAFASGWIYMIREVVKDGRSGPGPADYPQSLVVESEQDCPEPSNRPTAARPRGGGPAGPQATGRGHRHWFAEAAIGWDGKGLLTVSGDRGAVRGWPTRQGGFLPGTQPGVFAGRWFDGDWQHTAVPAPTDSASAKVAEIAALVDLERHMVWQLLLLDECARALAAVPVLGFVESDVIAVARAAGVRYRAYDFQGAVVPTGGPDFGLYFPAAGSVHVSGPPGGMPLEEWRRRGA